MCYFYFYLKKTYIELFLTVPLSLSIHNFIKYVLFETMVFELMVFDGWTILITYIYLIYKRFSFIVQTFTLVWTILIIITFKYISVFFHLFKPLHLLNPLLKCWLISVLFYSFLFKYNLSNVHKPLFSDI